MNEISRLAQMETYLMGSGVVLAEEARGNGVAHPILLGSHRAPVFSAAAA